jgi:FixJ family two-component response regulator
MMASRDGTPNCLIVDVRLKAQSGLDFQHTLAQCGIKIPVVLMSGHSDVPMCVRGMKQGAVDFLTKPFRPDDMLSAVATAIRLDRRQRDELHALTELGTRLETLSDRERQVFRSVVAGQLNKQIAATLGLSNATVKLHRGSVMRKMQAKSFAHLIRMGEALGIRDERILRFRR